MLEPRRLMSTSRLEEILQRALKKREPLLSAATDSVRLLDGEGDGLPGVYLEKLGPAWLVATTRPSLSPDLQSVLSAHAPTLAWKRLDQHQKESPRHLSGKVLPKVFLGRENGLSTRLSFQSGYSQGIFLDQRDNRRHLMETVQKGQTVLNTFAYTGMFSVAAAAAGATTTTLDLSQVYLDWTKENFTQNQLDPSLHYFCKGDTFHWLKRFQKQGRRFDHIILDPPTFSRDHKGKVFRAERDFPFLFELALNCLSPGGTILACTNARRLTTRAFEGQLRDCLRTSATLQSVPMPVDFPESPYLKSVRVTLT